MKLPIAHRDQGISQEMEATLRTIAAFQRGDGFPAQDEAQHNSPAAAKDRPGKARYSCRDDSDTANPETRGR